MIEPNNVVAGDCIKILGQLLIPQADLIFADPPFNIGYKYDLYEDRKKYEDYHAWTEKWMAACCNVLKPTGSLWVAIGDDYAAELRIIGRQLGLHLRNWVIWHYTFGQATKTKFARSHTHLLYWTKDPKRFTFNDMGVRIPSARQTTYADKRANPKGKLPDDVWSFSRVCGTFHERVKWHPCQMPETVLERIIRVSSNPGDLVVDPFSGSGTTLVVAARMKREYFGIDISRKYVKQSIKRIEDTLAGRRRTTEISENPEAKRAERRVKRGTDWARKETAQGTIVLENAVGGQTEPMPPAAGPPRLPPMAPPGKTRRWLWVVLLIAVPCTVLIGLGTIYAFIGWPVEVTAEDRAVIVDIADLAECIDDFTPDPGKETIVKRRAIDFAVEVDYEYDDPDDDDAPYLNCTVTVELKASDAIVTYLAQWHTMKIATELGQDSVTITERNDLFSWGDQSRLGIVKVNGRPVGNIFVAQRRKVFFLEISGVYFDDAGAVAALLQPKLSRLEHYAP